MQNRKAIAVSAFISICAFQASGAQNSGAKKSLSMVPGVVSPPPVSRPPGVVPNAVSRSTIRRAASSTYPASHFQRGQYLKQRGELDSALVEFLKAAQENPQNVRAFYEQAVIFKQKGYNKLAQSALQQALAVNPDFRDARVLLASIFLETGAIPNAAQELLYSLGLSGKSTPAKLPPPPRKLSDVAPKSITVIQTPHGKVSLPAPVPHAQPPANPSFVIDPPKRQVEAEKPPDAPDPFQQRNLPSDLDDLLKGIPGIDPHAATTPQQQQPAAAPSAMPSLSAAPGMGTASGGTGITGETSVRRAEQLGENAARQVQQLLNHVNKQARSFDMWSLFSRKGSNAPDKRNLTRSVPVITAAPGKVVEGTSAVPTVESPKVTDQPPAPSTAKSGAGTTSDLESEARIDKAFNRRRKHRVAAWMDNLLDGRHDIGLDRKDRNDEVTAFDQAPDSDGRDKPSTLTMTVHDQLPNASPDHHHMMLNPIKLLARHASRAAENSALQPVLESTPATLAQNSLPSVMQGQLANGLPPSASSMPSTPPATTGLAGIPQSAAKGNDASQQQGWFPSSMQLFRRAVAWVPMPVWHPFAAQPMPSATPTQLAPPVGPLPQPIAPMSAVAPPMPTPVPVAPPARSVESPAPLPQMTAELHSPGAPPAPQPVQRTNNPNGLDNFIAALPKELASTLQQVLAPGPIDVPATPGGAPLVESVTRAPSGTPPVASPTPVTAQYDRQYENLVSANFGAQHQLPTTDLAGNAQPAPQATSAPLVPNAVSQAARGFSKPNLTSNQQYVMNSVRNLEAIEPKMAPAPPPLPPLPPDDAYSKRMKYLVAHGTGSLMPGEAFMFSEETGEGIIFLKDGSTVRRKIAHPRDSLEVARQRRPDVLTSQDLQYSLSLLGKVIKPKEPPKPQTLGSPLAPPAVNDLLKDSSNGFFTWVKNVFKI